jgi:hypothetical protein
MAGSTSVLTSGKRWGQAFVLVLGLLLCFPVNAAQPFELRETAFIYRPEAHPFFLETIQTIRNKNSGYLDPKDERQAYRKAYDSVSGTDIELNAWREKSQAAPLVFQVQTYIHNRGSEPSPETPIRIEIMALLGETSSDANNFLVDEEYIRSTAQWVCFQVQRGTIPILARHERYRFISNPIAFGDYLAQLKGKFPIALKAVVTVEKSASEVVEIPVYPATFTGQNSPL